MNKPKLYVVDKNVETPQWMKEVKGVQFHRIENGITIESVGRVQHVLDGDVIVYATNGRLYVCTVGHAEMEGWL